MFKKNVYPEDRVKRYIYQSTVQCDVYDSKLNFPWDLVEYHAYETLIC